MLLDSGHVTCPHTAVNHARDALSDLSWKFGCPHSIAGIGSRPPCVCVCVSNTRTQHHTCPQNQHMLDGEPPRGVLEKRSREVGQVRWILSMLMVNRRPRKVPTTWRESVRGVGRGVVQKKIHTTSCESVQIFQETERPSHGRFLWIFKTLEVMQQEEKT